MTMGIRGHRSDCSVLKPNARGPAPVASIVSALEITLGLVFVVAATSKVINATEATALAEFLLPTGGKAVLLLLVPVEWAAGIALIAGFARRYVVPFVIALLTMFSFALGIAGFRGFDGSCGCFAIGESAHFAAVRNTFLIAFAVLVWLLDQLFQRDFQQVQEELA